MVGVAQEVVADWGRLGASVLGWLVGSSTARSAAMTVESSCRHAPTRRAGRQSVLMIFGSSISANPRA